MLVLCDGRGIVKQIIANGEEDRPKGQSWHPVCLYLQFFVRSDYTVLPDVNNELPKTPRLCYNRAKAGVLIAICVQSCQF